MSEQWTKIVVARHGETRQNKLNLLLSRKDVPLNRQGRKQALKLHDSLSDYTFSTSYTSPLSLAYETAWLALDEDTPLHEVHFESYRYFLCRIQRKKDTKL